MIQTGLADFIQQNIRLGHDINSIREYLLNYGYTPADVEDSINYVYKRGSVPQQPPAPVRYEVGISKSTIFAFAAIFFGIIFTTYIIYSFVSAPSATPERLLDLRLEPVGRTTITAGETTTFIRHLSSIGTKRRYDIEIKYEMYNRATNEIVNAQEETAGVETAMSSTIKMIVPEGTKPGNYDLKATATYGRQVTEASFMFKVVKEEKSPACTDRIKNYGEEGVDCGGPCQACQTCQDGIQNQGEGGIDCGGPCNPCEDCPTTCEDNNECTRDLCSAATGFKCLQEAISPCCGNRNCEPPGENFDNCPGDCIDVSKLNITVGERRVTPVDIINEARAKSKTDPNTAARMCDQISIAEGPRDFDRCYTEVAKAANQSDFCDYMQSENRKDNCYMDFAMGGDYSVCGKITGRYMKQTCSSLRYMATAPSLNITQVG